MKLLSLRLAAGAAVAAGALAVTLPAAVVAQPSGGDACFHLSHLDSSRMAEDHHAMYLRVSGNQYYRMEFSGACNSSGNEPVVLHPFSNGDLICRPIDVNVTVRDTHEGCIPTSLKRLTPDELAQVPPKDRP